MPDPRDTVDPIDFLEPDQLSTRLAQPVPRADLGPGIRAALWGLRVLVLVVTAMVVYTFITQLR